MKMEIKHKCQSCGGHGINACDATEECERCDGDGWITKPEYEGNLALDMEVLKYLDSKIAGRPEPKNGFDYSTKCMLEMATVILNRMYRFYVGERK